MTERREDMATLYSQAHLEGTRYWDFSASAKQVRGQFRRRIVTRARAPSLRRRRRAKPGNNSS